MREKPLWDLLEEELDEPDEPYETLEESPDSHAWHKDARKYRAELFLNQEELFNARLDKMNATEAERECCLYGALAIIEYRKMGTTPKTADEYVTEMCPGDIKRQIKLFNVIIPWARHLQGSDDG